MVCTDLHTLVACPGRPHPQAPAEATGLVQMRVSVAGKGGGGGGWSQFLTSLGARRRFPLPAPLRLWTQTSELTLSSPFLPRNLGVQDALTLGGKGQPPSGVAKRQRLEQKSGGPSAPSLLPSSPPLSSPFLSPQPGLGWARPGDNDSLQQVMGLRPVGLCDRRGLH